MNHALSKPPTQVAQFLHAQLLTLTDAGYEEAAAQLAERLITDHTPTAELCAELISTTNEIPLLTKTLHHLDELCAAAPHHVRTTHGFKTLAHTLPHQHVLPHLVHLRILLRAERTPLPTPGPWPDPDTLIQLIGPALAARRPDGPSPLCTALAAWRTPPTDPVPAKLVLELTAALLPHHPEHFKSEDVLDLIVDSTLRAPVHDQNVVNLIRWLHTQPLRSAQQDAINIHIWSSRLTPTTDKQTFIEHLDKIASALRDAARVPVSPAVRKAWIDALLDALFDPTRPEPSLWFEAIPTLTQCPNEHLIHEYSVRVRTRHRSRATTSEQLLLANAVAEWMLARPTTEYWRQERAELLKWAFPDHAEPAYAATLNHVLIQKVPNTHLRHECGY